MDNTDYKPKSFWKRPEGVTGAIFLAGIVLGGGFFIVFSFAGPGGFSADRTGIGGYLISFGSDYLYGARP